ncbi:MAG: N-acetyltransferase [Anaerolineae bacterium]|nr:N-acetyltransferase [Anaerolineae bacterium]
MTNTKNWIIRRARPADVSRMIPLLNKFIQENQILPRTEEDVYRTVREWVVAEAENTQIVGMGSLAIMAHDLAEIRSLVIHPNFQGWGIGRQIVEMLLAEAVFLHIGRIFALTRKPDFFLKLGFQLTRIEKLPRKVRRDCVFCPIFHACDEVALIIYGQDLALVDTSAGALGVSKNGKTPSPVAPLWVEANHEKIS